MQESFLAVYIESIIGLSKNELGHISVVDSPKMCK